MKPKRPTRTDVAIKAGVAPSTVTLILGNKGNDLRIPEATQARVREAARSLGYYPNRLIQSVMRGRSGTLGLYLRHDQFEKASGYWPALLVCLMQAAAREGVQLLVHCGTADMSTEEVFARQAGGIVDGVMIVNSGNDPIVARIIETGLPAVEVGDPFSQLPFVGVDGVQGIRLAMERFASTGRHRPALVSYTTHYVANAQARLGEFQRCARELFGIDEPGRRIIEADTAKLAFPAILRLDPRPDALLCTSDELVYNLITLLEADGLRVPADVAMIGFDCLEALGSNRTATSVATPMGEMALLAIRKLLSIIEDKPIDHDTLLEVNLRIGDTA
jgi:DNA-binding LacI/PurR family transcriptional regulator